MDESVQSQQVGQLEDRDGEETEPQMFTRYVKSDLPGSKELPADGWPDANGTT
jgi:hypothetical protein